MDPTDMHYTTLPLSSHNVAVQFHTVHWEDHFNHLLTTLKDFTLLNILTDTILVMGSLKVPVHRVMLSCYSSYLKEFLTNETLNCYILINDIQESLLQALIDYIYTGVTSVSIINLNDWYKTTKLLRLDSLLEAGRSHCSEDVTYFTWPQHREMILQYLWQSRSNPSDCDVILVTNNFSQSFAHSSVLGACSRYLLNIFLRHTDRNKKKPYVLILQNVKSEDLEVVLEFCYRGNVSVLKENMSSVYDTAELLGLQTLCSKLVSIDPRIEKMSEIDSAKYASDVVSRIKTSHFMSQKADHSIQLQNIFQNFLEYEDLVDITLLKDKQFFTAHIVVLSAFSMYFKNLARYLQHSMKDAFVLVKDLRTHHVRAFLDYIYKGEAEFVGTTEAFYGIMSEWIDFTLLSISESETCQILSNVSTSVVELKPESEAHVNVYNSNVLIQNTSHQQKEILVNDEAAPKNECKDCDSRNVENDTTLKVDSALTTEKFEETDDTTEKETVLDENEREDEAEDEMENIPHKRWRERDSVLICYTCSKNFESRKQLREHLIIHPHGRIMKCQYCGKGFNRPSQMKLHIRIHTGSKPFSCKHCGHAFAAKSTLRKHIDIHAKDKGKMFECAVCNKSFSRKEYLEEHIRTHTGNKPFKCNVCHKSFVGRTGLNHHKKTHVESDEKKDSMCEVCGKSFTRHALWTHVKSHEKTHSCHHCSKYFSTASALRVHVTGTHLGHRSYQCEVCGKGFVQKNHLIRHKKVHESLKEEKTTKPFPCGKCPQTFKTERKLESHTKLEHIEPGERPYSCEICNKRFAGRSTVIYHRRAHTGERPHCCQTCGKAFMRPDALRQHITSHTGERRHQCSICNRKFATKSTLKKHTLSHKETPENLLEKCGTFNCDVCHKSFQSKSLLSLHSRVHNSCRPFRCHICRKSFRYQDSLTKHLHIHTEVINQGANPDSELSGMYSFQIYGQTYEPVSEMNIHTKENEDHNYTTENLIHNTEKDTMQQYVNPPAGVADNICVTAENKTSLGVPGRRPYTITIDGNLCCNTGDQSTNTNILPENGNVIPSVDISQPPPPPPSAFHPLSHSHQNLDVHPVSVTASRIHDQDCPHIEMIGNPPITYTEPLSRSFLFSDDSTQISQEISRQKVNR